MATNSALLTDAQQCDGCGDTYGRDNVLEFSVGVLGLKVLTILQGFPPVSPATLATTVARSLYQEISTAFSAKSVTACRP